MATGAWVFESSINTTSNKDISEWPKPRTHPERRRLEHRHEKQGLWSKTSAFPAERLDVLEQREYIQSLLQAQQKADALSSNEWLLKTLAQQIQFQQQWLKSQQQEIDALKRRLQKTPAAQTVTSPDAFQRWMIEHNEEIEKYRGKHVAINAETGIIASADSYSDLVNELDHQKIADDQVVIEFISPTFLTK